ncbi:MAG TPA: amidase [Burkholderiaceae bacterium]|jgi:Asp-tRNA(Asn)/Glu-tRNA(Gln) amidotransferase A subunit family amidase|nr:amidase [Burkholderiaceae bacterium]
MNSAPLNHLDAWQLVQALARRELRAEDLMQACLDRIAEREDVVHAFAHLDPDAALAQARALDAGATRGPLHGLPLGVKDLLDTADMPTGYGSPIYAGQRPAADAATVALCREAGAVVAGKTVTTEFAYFHPGPTANPHNPAHTPGGSSSGSAAAVADRMLPLALGTQTAGSVIRPAAYCGVVGFKPSWGRVPRAGVKSLSETLDTIGGFGRSVRDVALLGSVLLSDARLAALAHQPDVQAPRIGLCRTPQWPQADGDTQAAWAAATRSLAPEASELGAVALPEGLGDLIELQKQVMAFETARALSHERVSHRGGLSERLRTLLDEGMTISAEEHTVRLIRRAQARHSVGALFDRWDVLLAPSATGEAPAGLGATGDPVFCRTWTLLGLPCVHLPFATGRNGLPVGLQLIGRWGHDVQLLAAAHWVHQRLLG